LVYQHAASLPTGAIVNRSMYITRKPPRESGVF